MLIHGLSDNWGSNRVTNLEVNSWVEWKTKVLGVLPRVHFTGSIVRS